MNKKNRFATFPFFFSKKKTGWNTGYIEKKIEHELLYYVNTIHVMHVSIILFYFIFYNFLSV